MANGNHTTTWVSGGNTKILSTDCWESETEEECLARHESALAFFQTIYPED